MSIQAPPNLYGGELPELIAAGINDWGGVSPLTPDHVNPEAPWPHLDRLAADTARAGCDLVERLTIYPRYVQARRDWLAPEVQAAGAALERWRRLGARRSLVAGLCGAASADDVRDVPLVASPRRSALTPLIERAAAGETARANTKSPSCSLRAAPISCSVCRQADELRQRMRRRHGELRRRAQHQLHEHLSVQVRLLCVLEGPHAREPARRAVPRRSR